MRCAMACAAGEGCCLRPPPEEMHQSRSIRGCAVLAGRDVQQELFEWRACQRVEVGASNHRLQGIKGVSLRVLLLTLFERSPEQSDRSGSMGAFNDCRPVAGTGRSFRVACPA